MTAVSVAYPLLDLLLSLLSLLLLVEGWGNRLPATFVLFGLGMVAQG